MCNPALLIVAQVASGAMSAYGQYQQGIAQQKYYNYLAESSRKQGELYLRTGKKQSELIQESAKFEGKKQKQYAARVESSQMAALVANGIDLSSVTSADLAGDTISNSKLDELAIRYNADVNSWSTLEDAKNKKWSANVQAGNYELAGKQAKQAGQFNAFNTLLGTAVSIGTSSFGGSTTTQGTAGWLKGYKNAPKGSVDMGSWTYIGK